MKYDTSDLCDIYHEEVNVVEPLFSNFGGRTSFGGKITTVKCFEDNGLLFDLLEENGLGRVLVVDGGGSVRRALINAELAELALKTSGKALLFTVPCVRSMTWPSWTLAFRQWPQYPSGLLMRVWVRAISVLILAV